MRKPTYTEVSADDLHAPLPAHATKSRTLPEGRQWLGRDVPGSAAQRRRQRQLAQGQISTHFVPARGTVPAVAGDVDLTPADKKVIV